jgi:acyl-CoA hydrolase
MQAQMTEIVMPGDANHLGTCFGGKIMSWIDMVAAIAAQRLVGTVVTASVDSIQFKRPIQVGDLVTLKALVNRVWNTSMEVGVSVLVQSHVLGKDCDFEDVPTHYILSDSKQACKAYLTFVAVDDRGKRRDVSAKQRGFLSHHDYGSNRERRWKEAEERREVRLANRKEGH